MRIFEANGYRQVVRLTKQETLTEAETNIAKSLQSSMETDLVELLYSIHAFQVQEQITYAALSGETNIFYQIKDVPENLRDRVGNRFRSIYQLKNFSVAWDSEEQNLFVRISWGE